MPTRWIATMAAIPVLLTAACMPTTNTPPPAPPADARPLTESGAQDQRLDDVTRELRDALEARHGRLDVEAYKVPTRATWQEIAGHYQAALNDWEVEPAVPEQIRAAQARAWKRHDALLAIALIDTPIAGERSDYKVLVVAKKR